MLTLRAATENITNSSSHFITTFLTCLGVKAPICCSWYAIKMADNCLLPPALLWSVFQSFFCLLVFFFVVPLALCSWGCTCEKPRSDLYNRLFTRQIPQTIHHVTQHRLSAILTTKTFSLFPAHEVPIITFKIYINKRREKLTRWETRH